MASGKNFNEKDGNTSVTRVVFGVLLAALIALPVMALIISEQNEGDDVDYTDDLPALTGDSSMNEASREAWASYLESAPEVKISNVDLLTEISEESEMEIIHSLPDATSDNVTYPSASDDDDYSDKEGAAGDADQSADLDDRDEEPSEEDNDDNEEEREVEEADIVKVVGDRIYVLNPYRGLIVVNLEDPAAPFIEGRAPVLGTPVSMYIVDFLGFVIVSNAPSMDGTVWTSSGRLYILDLLDPSSPRIVKMVDIEGYPLDSRRVGDVIYVVSNEYQYDYGGWRGGGGMLMVEEDVADDSLTDTDDEEDTQTTNVISIAFNDPATIGERDRVSFEGVSGLVHASQFAIFIPQISSDYYDPETKFVYVDISDPKGDIEVRGTVSVPGILVDRYQMDHYKGMFRVVTQEWPTVDRWDALPESTLYVVDCRDPDDMVVVGKVLVDDHGNLMATRFAGERAYTIHLPESIDPLDVIDLSDPANPQVTDVLELPGWVEHMEVIGYDIIALGVDNDQEDGWKVAVSLFDVEDADNAVMKDRVMIGEGPTYSDANYDPKALTILKEEGLVLVPYSSYNWYSGYGSTFGIQIVSFDLDEGDLALRGSIDGAYPVTRTREVNGNIVTTSERTLQSVDISDLDAPVIEATVDLSENVADAFVSDGKIVSLISPYWGEKGAKIKVCSMDAPDVTLSEISVPGLDFEGIERNGNVVFIKGIRQGAEVEAPVWEVHGFDMTDPTAPVVLEAVTIPVPDYSYSYPPTYYDTEDVAAKEGVEVRDDEITITSEEPVPFVYYDPFSWTVLDDDTVVAYTNSGYMYYYDDVSYGGNTYVMKVVRWDTAADPVVLDMVIPYDGYGYLQGVYGSSEGVAVCYSTYDYYYYQPRNVVHRFDIEGTELVHEGSYEVPGSLVGVSENTTLAYSQMSWWDNENGKYHQTVSIYKMEGGELDFLQGLDVKVPVGSVLLGDDHLVVTSGWNDYYYYGYYDGIKMGADDAVAYSEGTDVIAPGDGSSNPDGTETKVETKVYIISLENGLFGERVKYVAEGYHSVQVLDDDTVLLQSGYVLVGLQMTEDGTLNELGPWSVNGYVNGGQVSGENIVLAMGLWGLNVLEL